MQLGQALTAKATLCFPNGTVTHACITSNRCALGLPPRPLDLCYQSGPQVFPGFEPGHDVTDPRMAQEVTLSL